MLCRWLLILIPFFARAGTNEGTLLLHNDTVMILTAVIQAADGSYLGQFSVQPGQQRKWTSDLYPSGYVKPGTPEISITPYTVIWQCPSQGIYSMCTGVSPGSYVKASICDGSHYCTPKKEADSNQPQPSSTLQKKK